MRSVLLTLSHRKAIGRLATRIPVTRPMVRRFVAGESMDEAMPAIERLHEQGMGTTVDVLGESVTAEADASAASARYIAVLDELAVRGLDRNVSLKPSQMGLTIDEGLARETIGAVVAKAVETGAFVRIDMENHPYTDRTLDLWRELRPADRSNGADVGVVIQAALRRSEADVEAVIAEGGRIRLCKGAYKEPESVAFQDKAGGRRGVRAPDAPPPARGAVPGARDARHAADQAGDRGRDRGGDRARRVRVPDALRRAPRPAGAAGRGRAGGSASTCRSASSGIRTSCAGSRSGRPTCRSCSGTCGGSAAGRNGAGNPRAAGIPAAQAFAVAADSRRVITSGERGPRRCRSRGGACQEHRGRASRAT